MRSRTAAPAGVTETSCWRRSAGVLVALEVAVLDEAVDEAADGRQADVQLLGEGGHADARVERPPGTRHLACDIVTSTPRNSGHAPAGDVAHQRVEVLEDGLGRHGAPWPRSSAVRLGRTSS